MGREAGSVVWKSSRFRVAVLAWTLAVTFLRALRLPNDFAEAHWLIDYRFGFIRRGLAGSLCSGLCSIVGVQVSPDLILFFSALVFCAFLAALTALLFRKVDDRAAFIPSVVFASSPFIVMSAHLLGYMDTLLCLIAIVSVHLALRERFTSAALVSSAGILVHESFVVIGLPLVLFAAYAAAPSRRGLRLKTCCSVAWIPAVVFLALFLSQYFGTDQHLLRGQLAGRFREYGFVSSRSHQVALWHTTSFIEFFREQGGSFPSHLVNPVVSAAVAPSLIALAVAILRSLRIPLLSMRSLFAAAAVLAPMLLHAVAWDTARISTYAIFGAFMVFRILTRTGNGVFADRWVSLLALAALLLNVILTVPLMDCEADRFSLAVRIVLYLPVIVIFVWNDRTEVQG